MAVRIGELLLKEKRITPAQLQEALNHQKANGGKVGVSLVRLGFVTDEEITDLLSKQYGVPSINLSQFEIDSSVIKLLPSETVQKYQIVPLSRAGATLTIAITDPTNVFAMDDIKFMTGYNVEPVVASETSVLEAHPPLLPERRHAGTRREEGGRPAPAAGTPACTAPSRWKRSRRRSRTSPRPTTSRCCEDLEQIDVASLEKQSGEAPVIRLVNLMLMSAIQKGASDIHIEPYEKEFRIRFRIDGILYSVMTPPMKFRDAITSRVKIMAKLDIAEKRLPQDGRIKIRFASDGATKEIDFRVSCLPTLFGEKIVLRLLDKDKLMLDMTKLGFEPESLARLEAADRQAVGHGAGHRADRQRQDQHALFVDLQDQHPRNQHHDRGGSRRVQSRRRQPGPGPREHRAQLRRGPALVPAPGPQHHPGR